jgi:hypothetical protein
LGADDGVAGRAATAATVTCGGARRPVAQGKSGGAGRLVAQGTCGGAGRPMAQGTCGGAGRPVAQRTCGRDAVLLVGLARAMRFGFAKGDLISVNFARRTLFNRD